jgi:methyl-accepting chemotaxis protein
MPARSSASSVFPEGPPRPRSGSLRVRLWLGCLGGVAAVAGGITWALSAAVSGAADTSTFLTWIVTAVAAGLVVAILLALWLDRVMIVHLRGLAESIATSHVADLRTLPAAEGWGELSRLTDQVQSLVGSHRQAVRGVEELALVREQLGTLRAAIGRWLETERWSEAAVDLAPVSTVGDALGRGLRRLDAVREQNEQAARQIAAALDRSLEESRESTEQAERGFVEATALLTTVRELQRLGGELAHVLGPEGRPDASARAAALEFFRGAAREAITELVESSGASVEHLASGVLRVRDIADQVHVMANRSTLIALHAALGGEGAPPAPEVAEDLRRLAGEVREAVDRTQALAREVEQQAGAAMARMGGIRERVAERLDRAPVVPTGSTEDAGRLLSRVREMIQDATQKGERLAAAGERVSRAAERVLRGLEEDVGEIRGLIARLSPPVPRDATPGGARETTAGGARETEPPLRLLERGEPDAPRMTPRRPGIAEERP